LAAHHTIVAGRLLVEGGELQAADLEGKLAQHRRIAAAMQAV
jgi:hypothetical protein